MNRISNKLLIILWQLNATVKRKKKFDDFFPFYWLIYLKAANFLSEVWGVPKYVSLLSFQAIAQNRARVIVMTDGEVDDQSSMVRFLLYTCDVDLLAIIETNSVYQRKGHSKEDWYEKAIGGVRKLPGRGNTSGGGGSYLSKLTMGTSSPYTVTATQIPYDFRAKSNSTISGLTAIEQSNLDPTTMYAATEDGTFFYSTSTGNSWSRSASFTGPTPWYLYGSTICASHITPGLICFGGSGYSNNAVYQSTNGGVSFTSISTGLPGTLVSQIVANPSETMLFAATDAGPYVYIRNQAKWFSLQGAYNPVQYYSSVEYISSSNTVRFSTMGRGIWDFRISVTLPLTLLDFSTSLVQQTVHLQWNTTQEIHTRIFGVERSSDGFHFSLIGSVNAAGNSTTITNYKLDDFLAANDNTPLLYYRLKM